MAPTNVQKRKAPPPTSNNASNRRKRAKTQDARVIAVQKRPDQLNVGSFVQAREFEIKALETSMTNSRSALNMRAFQQVPRNMRRRTASHNVKKVPKRLQARAKKEMIEDNTRTVNSRTRQPTGHMRLRLEKARRAQGLNKTTKAKRVASRAAKNFTDPENMVKPGACAPKPKKNVLSGPPKATSKFRRRQVRKAWLPTHIFHAKRAQMPQPTEPLWRMAIPLTPTEKDYRPTHRATGSRGAVSWDMSYMSTMYLTGVERSLAGLLKSVGFGGEDVWVKKGARWRAGTRSWQAWAFERDSLKRPIAPIQVIWCPQLMEDVEMNGTAHDEFKKRSMFIRVHPSAFLELWNELLKVAKMQRPPVMLEDIRFEIGSIDVMGPASTEALLSVLKPIIPAEATSRHPEAVWKSLDTLTNPASLPRDIILSFCISDPRLHQQERSIKSSAGSSDAGALAQLIVQWPPDNHFSPPALFSRPARLEACRFLASQKAINRRTALEAAGEKPSTKRKDPSIPVMVLASRPISQDNGSQGTWTVLLPWKCVPHVWNALMYCPLSSGGTPRFGGLAEKQQVAFEAHEPWFPGDFPATLAGWAWEMTERDKRYKEWMRKPPGRRLEFGSIHLGKGQKGEIGMGWACDWERLVQGSVAEKAPESNQSAEKSSKKEEKTSTAKEDAMVSVLSVFPPLQLYQLPPTTARWLLTGGTPAPEAPEAMLSRPALAAVKVKVLQRGNPKPRARIYRLPSNDPELRTKWLEASSRKSNLPKADTDTAKSCLIINAESERERMTSPDAPSAEDRARLAASLLSPNDKAEPPLAMPPEEDLIGFLTTGGFCLSEGKGSGIGSVYVQRVLKGWNEAGSKPSERQSRLCIIRNTGTEVGWVGLWDVA